MSSADEPVFLTVEPKQPALDQRLKLVANATRSSLGAAMQYLVRLPTRPSEQEKCVWMWHTALTCLTWDVSETAILAGSQSLSLRAVRSLNRMLLEYAARVHLYLADPALAEAHISEAEAMLRRVMKPVAANPVDEPGSDVVKKFVESGTTKATQPKTHEMMAALVAAFIDEPTKRDPYIDFLDAEYALGSGYVHGSQSSFFDLFDGSKATLNPRTRVLHREAEVRRCVTTMLALLVAIERKYNQDFGVREHVAALRALGPYEALTSMGTHDTLLKLLGVQ